MRVLTSGSGFSGKPWISSVEISKYEIAGVMLESSTLVVLDRMVDTDPEVRVCVRGYVQKAWRICTLWETHALYKGGVYRVGGTIDYD